MQPTAEEPLRLATISAADRAAAWRCILRSVTPEESEPCVAAWLARAQEEPAWAAGLVEARRGSHRAAIAWLEPLGGLAAMLWAPWLAEGESLDSAVWLVEALVRRARREGLKQIQSLIATDDPTSPDVLTRAGFECLGRLQYLACFLSAKYERPQATRLQMMRVAPDRGSLLSEVVERTYQQTLDLPQLDGLRSAAEVLEEYRRGGNYTPEWWWLATDETGQPIGCLIMADDPIAEQAELVYMGIVPEARGHGWGRALVAFAQRAAWQRRRARLLLAVAAENRPAVEVYAAMEFVVWLERVVYVDRAGAASRALDEGEPFS